MALQESGIVLKRGWLASDYVERLRSASEACFQAIDAGNHEIATRFRFTPFSQSVIVPALGEFGAGDAGELLPALVRAVAADDWHCDLEQSWVRRRFAPTNAPPLYQPNCWHQDGALGVKFDGDLNTMTQMLTCWIPLCRCGQDAPGLEFVRQRLDSLVHYDELDDAALRRRFDASDFWTPEVGPRDAIVFQPEILHRTWVRPEMNRDRISVEFRFFPSDSAGKRTETRARARHRHGTGQKQYLPCQAWLGCDEVRLENSVSRREMIGAGLACWD